MVGERASTECRILVSACLLGHRVRYDGTTARLRSAALDGWDAERRVIPFCPEVAGGCSVPRPAAEIVGGDGRDVLDGRAVVLDEFGTDVTNAYLAGARLALARARACGAPLAVLRERSPSCGTHWTHDGRFGGGLIAGMGVAAALLRRAGIQVFSEDEIELAGDFVRSLETTEPLDGAS
jgi:uncharacterized protein YbbK (DUF523 family)